MDRGPDPLPALCPGKSPGRQPLHLLFRAKWKSSLRVKREVPRKMPRPPHGRLWTHSSQAHLPQRQLAALGPGASPSGSSPVLWDLEGKGRRGGRPGASSKVSGGQPDHMSESWVGPRQHRGRGQQSKTTPGHQGAAPQRRRKAGSLGSPGHMALTGALLDGAVASQVMHGAAVGLPVRPRGCGQHALQRQAETP